MANRLAASTSPYLKQHENNPVEWFPWGEEAFAEAKARNLPIFLSVGYSSCHWCHVMAHESFEDAEVAEALNSGFIAIKVDREERPDVDEAFMTYVQLTTGRGGWPMSVFLTPDGMPFFGGTYWPKESQGQHMGFLALCRQVTQAWGSNQREITESATEHKKAMQEALGAPAPEPTSALSHRIVELALQAQVSQFDGKNGGFGTAPKFPPHTAIEFLLDYALIDDAPIDLREAALAMSLSTLRAMLLGGLHDHVGGGFHRYSTDEQWRLTHFEKMLYDNALMLANIARAMGIAQMIDPLMVPMLESAAVGIVKWLAREMTTEAGLFASALDADTDGEEGKFYVWTTREVRDVLGEDAEAFIEQFQLTDIGNFEDEATKRRTGANVLHALTFEPTYDECLEKLRFARAERTRPGLDHKALVGWNGLMISALGYVGVYDFAERAALTILEAEAAHGELPHQIVNGVPSGSAYLDDYAAFTNGLIGLARMQAMTPDRTLPFDALQHAVRLKDIMVAKFYDTEHGGFFSTSSEHEVLFGRTKPVFDQPVPSANALAIRVCTALQDDLHAIQSIDSLIGWMERAPQATEALFSAALAYMPAPETVEDALADAKPSAPKEITVKLSPQEIVADSSGVGHGVVRLSIPEGMHINTNTPAARWLTPTLLKFQPVKADIDYPKGDEIDNWLGEIDIPFRITLPSGEKAVEFEIAVSFQPCTETECLANVEKKLSGVVLKG